MKGKLYGVGTGPGNSGLMTLEGVEKLKSCQVVVLPNKDKEKCIAYKIGAKAVPEIKDKELLFCDFPMTKDEGVLEACQKECAEKIAGFLEKGKLVVFLTIGDPAVYSTYMYVHFLVEEMGYECQIVSGVTSFCSAAAALGISLGDKEEQIHILPGSYDICRSFELSGTLVFMKSGKKLGELKEFLAAKQGEYDFDFYAASNVGLENQVLCKKLEELDLQAGYLTVVIIKNLQKKNPDGHRFFQNRQCRYFPCHKGISEEEFNCLFCYCPLYFKGTKCGGNFVIKDNGVKSCVNCSFPHKKENYGLVNEKLKGENFCGK